MPRSKADDVIESERFRKIMIGLSKIRMTDSLLRLILPLYGKANNFNFKDLRVFAVGQSHLDSAWNWRWAPDTAPYKISHTMGYNLDRLKRFPPQHHREGYFDGYKFSFPAPAHYEYILSLQVISDEINLIAQI